jgi:hypothetical protein
MFSVIMRIMSFFVTSVSLQNDLHVFKGNNHHYCNKLNDKTKNKKIGNYTLYSYGYTITKEERGHNIPLDVTSKRTRHSAKSNKQVIVDDFVIKSPHTTTVNMIPLNWPPSGSNGLVHYDKFITECKMSDDSITDFKKVNKLVTSFVEGKDDANDAKAKLEDIIRSRRDNSSIQKELKILPLGTSLKVNMEHLPSDFPAKFKKNIDFIKSNFKNVDEPSIVPELAYFEQMIYGNWRKIGGPPGNITMQFRTRKRTYDDSPIAEFGSMNLRDDVEQPKRQRTNASSADTV